MSRRSIRLSVVAQQSRELLAVLYWRQAAYETQLAYVDARLDDHDDQIGELHDQMECVEEVTWLI